MKDDDLEQVFRAVFDQALEISLRWKLFRQLFDSGEENIALLNKSGSFVFGLLQRLIFYDIVLSLARLTDPAKSFRRYENASIENLFLKASCRLTPDATMEVKSLREKLNSHTFEIRKYRDKALAHADLNHAARVEALPGIAYDDIEAAMLIVQKIVTILGVPAGHRIQHFDVIFPFGTDGKKLLKVLRLGQATASQSAPSSTING
jgi:hypothetical protein